MRCKTLLEAQTYLGLLDPVPLSRLPASETPGPGIIPISGSNSKIAAGFLPLPDGFNEWFGPTMAEGASQTGTILSVLNIDTQGFGPVLRVAVSIGNLNSGALVIQHMRETAPGIFTVVATRNVTATQANAVNYFDVGTHFAAFTLVDDTDYVALQIVAGGANLKYRDGTGAGYRSYLGTASGAGLSYPETPDGEFYFQVSVGEIYGPVSSGSAETTISQIALFNATPQKGGRVSKVAIQLTALNNGKIKILHLRQVSPTAFDVINSYEVTGTIPNAVNLFVEGTDFPSFTMLDTTDFLGIQVLTGGAGLAFKPTGSSVGYQYHFGLATGTNQDFSGTTATGELYYVVTLGETFGPTEEAGITSTSGAVSAFNVVPQVSGPVTGIELDIGDLGNGSISAQHCRVTSPGVVTVLSSFLLTATAANSTNTFEGGDGLDFPIFALANTTDYVAFQTAVGGATVRKRDGSGAGYRKHTGTAAGPSQAYDLVDPGEVYCRFRISYGFTSSSPAPDPTPDTLTTLSEEYVPVSALPASWVNAGGFTFSIIGARATAAGLSQKLRSNRSYGADRFTDRYRFKLGDNANVLGFHTTPTEGGTILAGSLLKINDAARRLTISGRYNGGDNPADLATYDTGITFTAGPEYELSIQKDGRTMRIRVSELTGSGIYSVERSATPLGFKTYPTVWNYDQGNLHGAPGFSWISGGGTGPLLTEFSTYFDVNQRLRVVALGDSITEGFAVTDAQRFMALARSVLGQREVLISGIGAATSSNLIQRFPFELNGNLHPEFVFVYTGTNTDGGVATNIPILANMIRSYGATPVFATVPTSGDGNVTAAAATAAVLALPPDVIKVRFDLALTTAGVGSSLITALYSSFDQDGNPYSDVHPNSLGHQRMFERLQLDCPAMFR